MAFSSVVRRLLISCPGDIPQTDLGIVRRAIERWNGIYGESFGSIILPISWGTHAAAEFGGGPQDILNRQLVDRCDICLALFANRLGTPTAAAESGTAEEIARLGESGRYVAVLRSRRPVDTSRLDPSQMQNLQEYLHGLSSKALILEYSSDDELSQRVDAVLAAAVARDKERADLSLEDPGLAKAEVWPRVDSSNRTTLRWQLVLANTGDAPARDVRVILEPENEGEEVWGILVSHPESEVGVEVLAPHTEIRYGLIVTLGMAIQVRCRVSWVDDRGKQENVATVRVG